VYSTTPGIAQEAANCIGEARQVWQDTGDYTSRDQEGVWTV